MIWDDHERSKEVPLYIHIYIHIYIYIFDIYTTHDTEGNTKDSRVKLKQATDFPLKKITESRSGDSKKLRVPILSS